MKRFDAATLESRLHQADDERPPGPQEPHSPPDLAADAFTAAFSDTPPVPLISVGESTGHLDETLENASQYYDRAIPKAIKRTFAVMEPLVIVVLAVVVLGAALSFFLALYKMVGSMGGRG